MDHIFSRYNQSVSPFKAIISTAVFLLILILFIQGISYVISNKVGINAHCDQVTDFITANESQLETLFLKFFDQAVRCRSEECKDQQINQVLAIFQQTDQFKFFGTSYFIRLNNDGNIEKWFPSGEVVTTIPETRGEKKVVRVLQGKARAICSQNWKVDDELTFMTYLKDGYSEAETIIPVKDGNRVIGAIVTRFGD